MSPVQGKDKRSIEIDLSEVRGKKYRCLPGCGLCCLCQPELLPDEVMVFKQHSPDAVVKIKRPHLHFAVALKREVGSCVLLDRRRCLVHDQRPHFCQQFPFHFHVGDQVRVEMDLSCRGAWVDDGHDVMPEVEELLRANMPAIEDTLPRSRAVYAEFKSNCVEAGVWRNPEDLREEIAVRSDRLADIAYLGEMLRRSYEDDEMDIGEMDQMFDPDGVDMEELAEAAMNDSMESLTSTDLVHLPVYCDPDMSWNLFMAHKGMLHWKVLDEDGEIVDVDVIDPRDIKLMMPTEDGAEVMRNYMLTLNHRDSFMGSAYYMVDAYGYQDDLDNVYFGAMASSALDLLWRASLLAHLYGRDKLDAEGLREGIIFFDMDRMDAPTIGAFI